MKDRFPIYLLVFAVFYIALYTWNLDKENDALYQHIEQQHEKIIECGDLIKAQREYINILEADYNSPLYRPAYPLNRDPI